MALPRRRASLKKKITKFLLIIARREKWKYLVYTQIVKKYSSFYLKIYSKFLSMYQLAVLHGVCSVGKRLRCKNLKLKYFLYFFNYFS